MRSLILAVAVAAAASASDLSAQAAKIDPGMTREQVVAALGQPLSARTRNGFTYLLYRNGCERTCGMNDLVVLDSGKVVDAVFRSSGREYTGASTSPRMVPVPEARKAAPSPAPLKVDSAAARTPPDPKTPFPDPLR
jgi:hypothetical protein